MSRWPAKPSHARSMLILIRHAHTDMAGRFCGISDPALSARGLTQLPALNQKLLAYPLTHIFSSPLQRAWETAESIAAARQLPIEYVEFLHELAFGSWERLDWDQVMARDPEYAQRWLDFYPSVPAPGGEYFEDFFQRVQYAMTAIAGQSEGGCAAVVTHAGVIRTFLGSLAKVEHITLDLAQCDYTSCWEVWREDGRWVLPAAGLARGEAAGLKTRNQNDQELTL